MPGFIAFINGLVLLIATGVGAYAAASFCYGGLIWVQGDHDRGKRHLTGSLIGSGIVLTCGLLGAGVAGLPHA